MKSVISLSLFVYIAILAVQSASSEGCGQPSNLERWSTKFKNAQGSVRITNGQAVLLDVSDLTLTGAITIEEGGALHFDTTRDFDIKVAAILVNGGLYFGSKDCPYQGRAVIQLTSSATEFKVDDEAVGRKVIAIGTGGILELHGAKGRGSSWTQLSKTMNPGDTTIQLTTAMSDWSIGDKLVVASTDFSPTQAEEFEITNVQDGGLTIEVTPAAKFMHFGEVTFGVDERAEVALLSRNIVIKGDDTQGAHLIMLPGVDHAQIEAIEFYKVGQDEIGRYPVHFHTVGDAATSSLKYNSVHDSNFRCYVLHATSGVLVESNVGYNAHGHCFYLEDGVEENNQLVNNLAINVWAKRTGQRAGSDSVGGLSSFWITNPNNTFLNNVAAGGDGAGFWIHTRNGPHGHSYSVGMKINPSRIPLLSFKGNKAHSMDHGIQIESTNMDAGDVPAIKSAPPVGYSPRDSNGKRVATFIENFVGYKNRFRAIWARLEDIVVTNGIFGDNYEGVQVATSGAHPPAPSAQVVSRCLFVGVTANNGTKNGGKYQGWDSHLGASYPLRGDGLTGWKVYDGTQYARECKFVNYPTASGGKYHTAIGIRTANHGQMATTNFLETSTFENVDRRLYFVDQSGDGGRVANLLDRDGSLSSYKGAALMQYYGYYSTPNCVAGTKSWVACPHKYNQLWVMDMSRDRGAKNQMSITRNQHNGTDHVGSRLVLAGFIDGPAYRWQPPVSVGDVSYLVSFGSRTPSELAFQLNNAEIGEYTQLTICYPSGTKISGVYTGLAAVKGGNSYPSKKSATELSQASSRTDQTVAQGESYFWDSKRSLLFITVKQSNIRENYGHFCPEGGCNFIWVSSDASSDGIAIEDCYDRAYGGDDSIHETESSWLSQQFTAGENPNPLPPPPEDPNRNASPDDGNGEANTSSTLMIGWLMIISFIVILI